MKKLLLYIFMLAAIPVLSFGGFGGEDVGKLHPVQVLMVRAENDALRILTDTEDTGIGMDAQQAILDMQQSAPGSVFLDTADYLLLEVGTVDCLEQLREKLRPSCCLCYVIGDVDLKQVGEYLQNHEPELTLAQYMAGERRLPYLMLEKGRLKLVQL